MDDFEAIDFFRGTSSSPIRTRTTSRCGRSARWCASRITASSWSPATTSPSRCCSDTERFSSCTATTGRSPASRCRSRATTSPSLIEEHRDELPFSDQLPSLDPPMHTEHRALLMRLITPKRLKENEAMMWQLADRLLDPLLARGEGDFIAEFAGPFSLLVIADLLGVPERGPGASSSSG